MNRELKPLRREIRGDVNWTRVVVVAVMILAVVGWYFLTGGR